MGKWVTRTAESVVLTDWPPGPGAAVDVDAQVLVLDLDLDLLGLGQDRHGGRRGVHPALGLGHRDPLDPVRATFVLQACPGVAALDQHMTSLKPPMGEGSLDSTSALRPVRSA